MFLSILYWDDVTPHTHRHGLITPASSSVYIWSPNWRVNRSKSLVSVCPGGSITVYGSASTGSTVPGISSFMLGGVRGRGGGEGGGGRSEISSGVSHSNSQTLCSLTSGRDTETQTQRRRLQLQINPLSVNKHWIQTWKTLCLYTLIKEEKKKPNQLKSSGHTPGSETSTTV